MGVAALEVKHAEEMPVLDVNSLDEESRKIGGLTGEKT